MALSQMQQIQSLGEALSWLERELSWGVPATQLAHLCGRIGELYACMVTNGQMALSVNQHGYDVRAGTGETISVKTQASDRIRSVRFNANTLHFADRIMVLRVNTQEMQVETLFDRPVSEARPLMRDGGPGELVLTSSILGKPRAGTTEDTIVRSVRVVGYVVGEHESGSIKVEVNGVAQTPTKTVLKAIAAQLGISLLNSRGNPYNTRQLGSLVIDAGEAIGALRQFGAPLPTVSPLHG